MQARIWSPLHQPIYFDHVTWLAIIIILVIGYVIIKSLGEK